MPAGAAPRVHGAVLDASTRCTLCNEEDCVEAQVASSRPTTSTPCRSRPHRTLGAVRRHGRRRRRRQRSICRRAHVDLTDGDDGVARIRWRRRQTRPYRRSLRHSTCRLFDRGWRHVGWMPRRTPRRAAGSLPNPVWKLLPKDLEWLLEGKRGPVTTVHPLGGCAMADACRSTAWSTTSGVCSHRKAARPRPTPQRGTRTSWCSTARSSRRRSARIRR